MDGTVRGLSLLVWPTGGRSWVLRYQINGKRRDMGLGRYPEVTLAEAREKALDARRLVKVQRRDPLAERGRVTVLTFKAAAEALIESKRPGWRNAKHAWQWETTLAQLAYPKLGALDVKQVQTGDVLAVLQSIWTDEARDGEPVAPAHRGGARLCWRDGSAEWRQPGPLERTSGPPSAQAV